MNSKPGIFSIITTIIVICLFALFLMLWKQNSLLEMNLNQVSKEVIDLKSANKPTETNTPAKDSMESTAPGNASSSSMGVRKFSDKATGISFDWPENYVMAQITPADITDNVDRMIAKFKHESLDSKIGLYVSKSPFSLQQIRYYYAPTGLESINPEKQTFGTKIFYYYGAGGGGVSYADQYFYNLNGKLLVFYFDGPYSNEKSPNDYAKSVAKKLLTSFESK